MSLRSEIAEQVGVVRRLLDEGWPEARTLGRALTRVEHITLVARGSSDNAATYGKYLLESVAGVVTALAARFRASDLDVRVLVRDLFRSRWFCAMISCRTFTECAQIASGACRPFLQQRKFFA